MAAARAKSVLAIALFPEIVLTEPNPKFGYHLVIFINVAAGLGPQGLAQAFENFPDTQSFRKFPRYPGIWEIPQIPIVFEGVIF